MRLFVAEKPSLGMAIAQGLGIEKKGRGYIECNGGSIVTWCIGHLLELYAPDDYQDDYKIWNADDLPIIPDQWKLKVKSKTQSQFKVVKQLISKASEIVNAGDPDREGSLLVDEVIHFCGKKADTRVLVADYNIKAVKKALSKIQPNSITSGLTDSALARSKADWTVGMNLTRGFSISAKAAGIDSVMSIGRVQTPTLGLIVRRDLEIENFKSHPFYGIEGEFKSSAGVFNANWIPIAAESYLDEQGRVIDKDFIKSTKDSMHGKGAVIVKLEKKEVISRPPLLFDMASLQKAAIKTFGMTSDQTLTAAQALYEKHKLTTYPRVDCEYLPKEHFRDSEQIVNNMLPKESPLQDHIGHADYGTPSPAFNDKEVEVHHAIVPCGTWDNQELNKHEDQVYKLICKQYLAQFMGNKVTAKTELIVEIGNSKNWQFKTTGSTIEKIGHSILFKRSENKILPNVSEGESLQINALSLIDKNTTPPKPFTEDTLIDALKGIGKHCEDQSIVKHLKETDGLGTNATRSKMIELLIKREYIVRSKTKLLSTPHGRSFIEILPKELTFPDSTALWESKLNLIAEKKLKAGEFLDDIKGFVTGLCGVARTTKFEDKREKFTCPKCGGNLNRIKKKTSGYFWGCAARDKCDYATDDKKGKPDLNKKEYPCPSCNKPLAKRKGSSGVFWGCTGFKDGCKYSCNDKSNKPDIEGKKASSVAAPEQSNCPNCSTSIKRLYSPKNNSHFWVHVGEQGECKKYINDDNGKPEGIGR